MTPPKAVLFDLDGTLLDTAHDLGTALNYLLAELQLPALAQATIRPAAGQGCKGLLKLGLNITEDHRDYAGLCKKLLYFYQQCLLNQTTFFPGIENALQFLEKERIPWGIVTNKPAQYTQLLMQHLQLTERASCIISGDTLANRKPHPEPILHACHLLKQGPADCLYVGDSAVDMQASKAAGMPALAALYGYIPAEENPVSWGADGYIYSPLEIIDWVRGLN